MEIQRINIYKDDRFPNEILLQHGAFVIDGHQIIIVLCGCAGLGNCKSV